MKFVRVCLCLLFGLMAMLSAAYGQTATGQVSGRVVDPGGAVVVGAKVQLINEVSQAVRDFTTDTAGIFMFPDVMPGRYTLRVNQQGFKTYAQKGITLGTHERAALGDLKLELGDVTTTVEVPAEAVRVATDTSDRSVSIPITQIQDTPLRGRNPLHLTITLPGVQTLASSDARGDSSGVAPPAINGGQLGQTLLNIDGVASQDSGNLNPGYLSPSVDAIAEVTLLVSNYTAEYGGRSGGQYTIITKSGTSAFHGSAYTYFRNEFFDANEWFNNANGSKYGMDGKTLVPVTPRPRYRYINPGGTIGGPLIIPGTRFNKSRTKLFFFFSYDYVLDKSVSNNTFTMPSLLERQGNFSQTVTTAGQLIPIYDPTGVPYPGNIIPATRISPAGQAMLNLFPYPDPAGLALDPTGNRGYNFRAQLPLRNPLDDKILRVDYNPGGKWGVYVRLIQDYQGRDGYGGSQCPAGGPWGEFPCSYYNQAVGAVGTANYTFTPTLINEFSWGLNRDKQNDIPLPDSAVGSTYPGGVKTYAQSLLPLKDANGQAIPLPRINTSSNYENVLPRISFGLPTGFSAQTAGQGVTGAPTFGPDSRWPFFGTDQIQSINDKVTWVHRSHILKAGIYIERMARNVAVLSTYNIAGNYYFGSDRANPMDTGYPYANALVGSIFAYGDDNEKLTNHARYTQIEWFVQDTWRIARRLTLDLGLRFNRVGDLYSAGAKLQLFNAGQYNASQSGQLLFPACIGGASSCTGANKIAINPVTGATFPFIRQGTFDTASYPAGGVPWSGMKAYDSHFWHVPPIQLGPRVGFAYDLSGNGKTAVRGGFAITPGRNWTVDTIGAQSASVGPMTAPPAFLTPIALYTSFAEISGAQNFYAPQSVVGGSQDQKVITSYNWSFGVQQDIGHGMIADASYVGNGVRNGYGQAIDLNAVPPYTVWNPTAGLIARFRDPTTSATSPGVYSTNLIRAMVGYSGFGAIPAWTYLGTANYNSLQLQLNRRVGRLQWNLNYTFARQITFPNSTGYQYVPLDLGKNVTGRTHAVNFTFGYGLPSPSRLLGGNAVVKQVLDGWRVGGNGAIFSGNPFTVSCSATNAPADYWTGTPTGGIPFRCQMGNNPWLPAGQYPSATASPRLQWGLNPANFALPAIGSLGVGNTPPTLFFGPGAFNLDLFVSKDFPLGAEGRALEFKVESFNTLNHFNPNNPGTSLTYNFVTGAQTNAAFGTITGAQVQARHVILSLGFRF